MLTKPEQRVLSAFAALANDSDFVTIRGWLEQCRNDLYAEIASTRDDVLVRWRQGMAQAIEQLLEKADTASEVLRKSR